MERHQIVVGVEETPSSAAALRWAARFARLTGQTLRVVHTWTLPSGGMPTAPDPYLVTAITDARARATRFVEDSLGAEETSVRWVLDVDEGRPGPVLARRSQDASLLVVGTGEHTGVRRLFEGSVSHYCLSHATCPVVAVPAPRAAQDEPRAASGA